MKFVLLYDDEIFQYEYMWKKIINVICIRERERHRNGRKFKVLELNTIPYPLSTEFVNKKLNEWTNGKFLYRKKELFPNKAGNLKSKHLKAVVYDHIPMVIQLNETQFYGIEIEIIESLAKIMNFTVEFYKSIDWETEQWGRRLMNGTYTGLIGEIVNSNAYFALGDLHYSAFHLNIMDLSIPHTSECLTFLTPESVADNSWKTLILPFSGGMWAGVLLSLFTVGGIFFIISSIHFEISNRYEQDRRSKKFKLKKDIFDKFANCILFTYSMLLLVTLPQMPKTWPLRILTGFYWIYCILVVVTYRASFTAILANPAPKITIDSIEQMASSKIRIGVWGMQNQDFFEKSLDDNTQKIGEKVEIVIDEFSSTDKIAEGNYAYYDNEYFLRYLRLQRADNLQGEEVLHIMKECVIHMPISIGLQKNSPLKPTIDKFMRRLIEGGFIQKWLKDSTKHLKAEEEQPQEALMDLKKFWSSFVALAIGYFFSILALIGEILHYEYIVKKHPAYDKYNIKAYYDFKRNLK